MPYRKLDDPPCYVNSQSNHHPAIFKQLPAVIGKRVSSLSCDLDEFNKAVPIYDSALGSSSFTSKLEYSHPATPSKHARRNRSRNILWFNPPHSMNVRSNVGKHFLLLLDKHFPEDHVLRSVFNRKNFKVRYSCMDNMGTIVKQHNPRVLKTSDINKNNTQRNYRKKAHCPLNGACLTPGTVYQATVTPRNRTPRIYIGMTKHDFKTRYRNHNLSFNNRRYSGSYTLSKFVWELKESNT